MAGAPRTWLQDAWLAQLAAGPDSAIGGRAALRQHGFVTVNRDSSSLTADVIAMPLLRRPLGTRGPAEPGRAAASHHREQADQFTAGHGGRGKQEGPFLLVRFADDPVPVIERMLAAANKAVIIAEPIRNLSTSRSPLVARIAVKLSGPGGDRAQRFNEQSLDKLFDGFSSRLTRSFKIPGGREKVYVLNAVPSATDSS